MRRLAHRVGAPLVLLARTVAAARAQPPPRRAILAHLAELGAGSALLVTSGLACLGFVLVTFAWVQARRYTGNVAVVGPAYFELTVREFTPLLVAVLVAARAGAAIAAQLGAMRVGEQLEALELCGADPLAELVAPRVLASLIAVPLLTVLGLCAASASAVATVSLVLGSDGLAFVDARFVDAGDVVVAAAKAVACGLYIPVAAAARGLSATGGASAVGAAVAAGVVDATVGCILIDFTVGLGLTFLERA